MGDARGAVRDNLTALPQMLSRDAFLQWRGRRLACNLLVEADDLSVYLDFRAGRIEQVAEGRQLLRSWDVALRSDADTWLRHWEPVPAPGFHDLFAMSKAGVLRIEGRLEPLMANLQFLKDVLALPRPGAAA